MGNKSKVYIGLAVSFLAFFTLQNQFKAYGATSAVDEVTITVPASCSLSSTVGSAHSATIETGIYQDDIGETTINAVCNDSEGFSVYAVGYTDGEYGNNTMKPGVTSATNAIATGTATSGDTSNWAMKLSSLSENFSLENSFGSYHLVPSDYIKVASYPSNTTTTAGVQLKTTYATYISSSQVADTYNGKVKYVILHPSSNMPRTTIQDLTYMQDFKDLSSDEKISVVMSMQANTTYNLIDNRDNRTYQIAKMKDGNIWMGENLDLGRTELTTNLTSENSNLAETVTAETFNGWHVAGFGYSGSTGQINSQEGIDEYSGTPYGTLYDYHAATGGTFPRDDYSVIGNAVYDICPAGWRMPSSEDHTVLYSYYDSPSQFRTPIANGGAAYSRPGYDLSGAGSSGWYWTSTTVGTYNAIHLDIHSYYSGSDTTTLHEEISTTYSAGRQHGAAVRCIAKKPDFSFTVSYGTGVSSITVNGNIAPDGATFTDERDAEFVIGITTEPRYALKEWSTTSGTIKQPTFQYTTYKMGKVSSTLSASTTYVETAIQNLSASSCTTTPLSVYDNRDGHVYKVQRYADGNCWMTDNLDLGRTELTTDLTSENTNLSTTVTASTFNGWKGDSATESYLVGRYINQDGGDETVGIAYGTNYNYYVASASTITGSINSTDALYDICPAGWRLPTGNVYGEFKRLGEVYDSVESLTLPSSEGGMSFIDEAFYWASTRTTDTDMNGANFSFSMSLTSDENRKTAKFVRCILKKPSHSLTVSYGSDVSTITIGGRAVSNGETISVEEYRSYHIEITPTTRYAFNNWSVTSGTIDAPTLMKTFYTAGTSDGTLSASATYVETPIQNLSASSCTTTPSKVYDNRDNRVYTIQRLPDGKCWMMENLDLGHTALATDLTSSNTNLSTTITASTFNSWKRTDTTSVPQTYTSGIFLSQDDEDSVNHLPLATLYNYYAASAGTISGSSSSANATYDICPAGWRLPTGSNSGELTTLYNNYGSYNLMRAPLSENGPAFVMAGDFGHSLFNSQRDGQYWSSTNYSNTDMYIMVLATYYSTPTKNDSRQGGSSIRCVMKNPYHTLTVSYGSGVSSVVVNSQSMSNGDTTQIEEGSSIEIRVIPDTRYAIDHWSATSGTISTPTSQTAAYTMGSSDSTLSVSVAYVETEMQNLNTASCTTATSSVYDNRDGHVYVIKRLLDGKCWMMENLDLGRTELTTDLTSSNTNLSSTITASTFNSWNGANKISSYTSGGFTSLNGTDSFNGMSLGTLYNYYATSAGTISGETNSYYNITSDICPAGWKLPSSSDYQSLYSYYNSIPLMRGRITDNGAAFALTGYYSVWESGQGERARYWTTTKWNDRCAYTLYITPTYLDITRSYEQRNYGNPVRCRLK